MAREIVIAGQISGTRNGKDWPAPGARLELPDDEATGLVNAGLAYETDDKRVKHIGNGNGGVAFSDEILAGAPSARDWTEGQQDTNLSRARALALDDRDTATVTREAAARAGLSDADTIPGRDPNTPLVGDGKPSPTVVKDEDGDDGARLLNDDRQEKADAAKKVESAAADPNAGTESATIDTKPAGRRTK